MRRRAAAGAWTLAWLTCSCNALSGVDDLRFQDPSAATTTAGGGATGNDGGTGGASDGGAGGGGSDGGRGGAGAGGCPTPPRLGAAGVSFDGASFLSRPTLSGVLDSPRYVLSVWYRIPAIGGQMDFFTDASQVSECRFQSDGRLNRKNDAASGNTHQFVSFGPVAGLDVAWHHLAISVNTRDPNSLRVYVDGSSVAGDATPGGVLDLTPAGAWGVGARGNGGNPLIGDLAELYFTGGQYLDLADPCALARLRTATGHPADLGVDGALVTGQPPHIYLGIRPGDAADALATNRGVGGDFSVSGSLTVSASSP